MTLIRNPFAAALFAAILSPVSAQAQPEPSRGMTDSMRQVTAHTGEMSMPMEAGDIEVDDALRFEPYQQLDEMFGRDDVVYLMRHGPTDWSKLDEKDVAPTDCANQRVMSEEGARDMRNLGTLLAANDVLPSRLIVSQWCRNQQTVQHLFEGFDRVDPAIAAGMPVETSPDLNLMLSLQGAKTVTGLRDIVSSWQGDPERPGPLLLVSHYTDIEELTQFRVFEGEILVLDPKRDNQVLGYVRLRSAAPDVGHFKDVLASPLLGQEQALDMVDRYYQALDTSDEDMLEDVLSEKWILHGASPSLPDRDAEGFMGEVSEYADGLEGGAFTVDDVAIADDMVTVRGTISGRHTGTLFGVAPTGRDVVFGAIGVHRVENGKIVESWQMADRTTLMNLITQPE